MWPSRVRVAPSEVIRLTGWNSTHTPRDPVTQSDFLTGELLDNAVDCYVQAPYTHTRTYKTHAHLRTQNAVASMSRLANPYVGQPDACITGSASAGTAPSHQSGSRTVDMYVTCNVPCMRQAQDQAGNLRGRNDLPKPTSNGGL